MKCPRCSSSKVEPYAHTIEEDDKEQIFTMLCLNCYYIGHRRKYTTWKWDICSYCHCKKEPKK